MKKIYLDYAATTPVDSQVLKVMEPYFRKIYGNPSSIYSFGEETKSAIEKARDQVTKFLGCKSSEIIFTGSATESDNMAIRGLIKALKRRKREGEMVHIVISSVEHKAVWETCKDLEKDGIRVTYIPVGCSGIVDMDNLEAEISSETDLVSVMYINNETGIIQPIEKIGNLIEKINKNKEHRIFFHTDAVQAANWLNCKVDDLKVDLLTLSAHKIYGPKGVGALYIRQGTPISSIITGGDQESGLRAGTENVANIVGIGKAISQIKSQSASWRTKVKSIKKLRDRLIKEVLKIPGSKLNGAPESEKRAPHIANFSFEGVEGEALVMSLDQEGIATSTGSACTSQALKPSHVLMAMGLSDLEAHSSLRVSLGKFTTSKEIDRFLRVLPRVIERLRKISGR